MILDKNCMGCFYYKQLSTVKDRCCHYIFIEDKKRPCEPGEKCTVKSKRRVCNEPPKENL